MCSLLLGYSWKATGAMGCCQAQRGLRKLSHLNGASAYQGVTEGRPAGVGKRKVRVAKIEFAVKSLKFPLLGSL